MFTEKFPPAFTLTVPGLSAGFQVVAFSGSEALNKPYAFHLQLVSEHPALPLEQLLQQPAFLAFRGEEGGVHGILDEPGQGQSAGRFTYYTATLRPRIAQLEHCVNQRIFQQRTVERIITEVLRGHGILADAYVFNLSGAYPERVYCVQYGESDLHFIQRLCEEEGIHFHFRHCPDNHQLVFADDQAGYARLPRAVPYRQGSGMVAEQAVIDRFDVTVRAAPNQVTCRDHDFEKPSLVVQTTAASEAGPALETYIYPGRFTAVEYGRQLAQRALERQRTGVLSATGGSNAPALASGYLLQMAEHPDLKWNEPWLLTEVRHEGRQPQVLEELAPHALQGGSFVGYRNGFAAMPWDAPYRPPLEHPKPRIRGTQPAIVIGPDGEEIHCDRHGRVNARFYWDRDGHPATHGSAWLRVAAGWAGPRYGSVTVPRVGMEVLVGFLEGDPDQPLVVGCLYHGEHRPPCDLPAGNTLSLLRTRSSPGGGGGNEVRIEDRKGHEEVTVHARRDWDMLIRHSHILRVAHERHHTVHANGYSAVMAEAHCGIGTDRKTEVGGDDHLRVGKAQHVRVDEAQRTEASNEIRLKAGQKIVIEAGRLLTVRAGGSTITLDGSGVQVRGATIKMSQGGAAKTGEGGSVALPLPPRLPSAGANGRSEK